MSTIRYANIDNDFHDKPFELICNLNKDLKTYATATDADSIALKKFFKDVQEQVKKIKKKSFAWLESEHQKINHFFSKFGKIKDPLLFYLIDLTPLHEEIDISFFATYLKINIGQIGGGIYDKIMKSYTHILQCFESCYLNYTLSDYLRMNTETIQFYDPFFRQKLRLKHQADFKLQEHFFGSINLKKFVFSCFEKFFPNVGWRWIGSGHTSHITTLKITLTMFEYGLWDTKDMVNILNYIYAISQIMKNLETFVYRDAKPTSQGGRGLGEGYVKNTKLDLILIRELFCKILINIIILYLDEDIYENRTSFPIDFSYIKNSEISSSEMINTYFDQGKIKKLFTQSFFQNQKLYTFYPYILVTYLTRKVIFRNNIDIFEGAEELQVLLEQLFTFISDINGDFFRESIKMIDPKYFPFYYLKPNNSLEKFRSPLMNLVKDFKDIQYRFRRSTSHDMIEKCETYFVQIEKTLDNFCNYFLKGKGGKAKKGQEGFDCRKVVITMYNPCQHILQLFQLLSIWDEKLEGLGKEPLQKRSKALFKKGIQALVLLCKENTAAQNYVLSEEGFVIIEEMFDEYYTELYSFIYDIFKSAQISTYLLRNINLKESLIYKLKSNEKFFNELFVSSEEGSGVTHLAKNIEEIENTKFQGLVRYYYGTKIFVEFLNKKFLNKITIQFDLQNEFSLNLFKQSINYILNFDFTQIHNELDFLKKIVNNPNQFSELVQEFDSLNSAQKHCLILEVCVSNMELLYYITKEFFLQHFFEGIKEIFEHENIKGFLNDILKYPYGIRFLRLFLNIYNIFTNFPNNHMLKNEDLAFLDSYQKNQTTEQSQQGKDKELQMENPLQQEHFDIEYFRHYYEIGEKLLASAAEHQNFEALYQIYTKSYLVGLFKSYCGFTHLFIQRYKEDEPKNTFYEITDMAAKFTDQNQRFLQMLPKKLKFSEDNDFSKYIKNQYEKSNVKYFEKYIQEFRSQFRNEYFDSKPNTQIHQQRFKGYSLLENILEVFKKTKTSFIFLHNYKIIDSDADDSIIYKSMRSSLQFNSVYREQNQQKFIQNLKIPTRRQFNDPKNVRRFLKSYYHIQKTYFFENQDENLSFQVLKTTDIQANNMSLYLDFFVQSILKLKVETESQFETNQKSSRTILFFNQLFQQGFISQILMFDNLIRHCEDFKFMFYKKLLKDNTELTDKSDGSNESIKKVLYFLWDVHKMLLKMVLNKPFRDESWTKLYTLFYLISNFLQNLCENDFVDFKEILNKREEVRSGSILQEYIQWVQTALKTTKLFSNKSEILKLSDQPQQIDIITRVIEGFTEVSNGTAHQNKVIVYKVGIQRWVGIIMRNINQVDSNFHDLKDISMDYILGLLEGYNLEIVNFIGNSFPVLQIFEKIIYNIKLLYIHQKYTNERGADYKGFISEQDFREVEIKNVHQLLRYYKKYQDFSDSVILSFALKLYHLMKRIAKVVKRFENFIHEQDSLYKNSFMTFPSEAVCIWGFLNKIVVFIEISHKNKLTKSEDPPRHFFKKTYSLIQNDEMLADDKKDSSLQLIFFQKVPACFFLTLAVKQSFFTECSIDSIEQKHEDFFDRTEQFKIISQYYEKLYKRNEILFILTTDEMFYYYRVCLYIIAVLLNLLLLFYWEKETEEFKDELGNINFIVTLLVTLSAAFSGCLLFFWFVFYYPLNTQVNREKFKLRASKDQQANIWEKIDIYITRSILKDPNFQTFFLHCLFTILGRFSSPFYYTVLLLLIIHLSKLILNVVMSFLINYDKLFYTLVIILAVINSFSYLLASNFRNQFHDEEVGRENLYICDTYFRCFFNTINLGLRGGGGISDYILGNYKNTNVMFYERFGFDLIFFIFVNLILMGIFFGIIVDSFGEFRDRMTQQEQAHKQQCVCCGLDKSNLEKKGIGFDNHVKYHEIWKYFNYIMYLKWKPESYYDGVDIQVNNCIQNNYNTDWMPIGRTMNSEEQY